MAADLSDRHRAPEQTHWIPLADLMTGLMMVFLLIAITYMVKVEAASQHIREIAVLYERMKVELYDDMKKEFEKDLPRWGAELDRDSTMRFREPDVLFPIGSSDLRGNFKYILDDFFPRYTLLHGSAAGRGQPPASTFMRGECTPAAQAPACGSVR